MNEDLIDAALGRAVDEAAETLQTYCCLVLKRAYSIGSVALVIGVIGLALVHTTHECSVARHIYVVTSVASIVVGTTAVVVYWSCHSIMVQIIETGWFKNHQQTLERYCALETGLMMLLVGCLIALGCGMIVAYDCS
jgi:hypothetical protein